MLNKVLFGVLLLLFAANSLSAQFAAKKESRNIASEQVVNK